MLNMALQLCGHEFHQHGVILIDGIAEGIQIRGGISLLINTIIRGVNAIEIDSGFLADIAVYKGRLGFVERLP